MEPEWLKKMRAEGRTTETEVNKKVVASDATTRIVPMTDKEAAGISEKHFQARVLTLAQAHGWSHYHTFNSERSDPGFPDLVLWRGECLLFAELKRESGSTTKEQDTVIAGLSKTGNEVYLWRPSNWKSIVARLSVPDPGE